MTVYNVIAIVKLWKDEFVQLSVKLVHVLQVFHFL